jgi:hypothetical protein
VRQLRAKLLFVSGHPEAGGELRGPLFVTVPTSLNDFFDLTRAQCVSARITSAQKLTKQQKLCEVSVQIPMKRRIALRRLL